MLVECLKWTIEIKCYQDHCFKYFSQFNFILFIWKNKNNISYLSLYCSTGLGWYGIYSFYSTAYTHFQNFTHTSKNYTHKMQNAWHLLQNEALHSKHHKNISKASICKHLGFLCVTLRIVLQKVFYEIENFRFGVWFWWLSVRFQKWCDK